MKNILKFASLLLAVLAFAACSNQEIINEEEEIAKKWFISETNLSTSDSAYLNLKYSINKKVNTEKDYLSMETEADRKFELYLNSDSFAYGSWNLKDSLLVLQVYPNSYTKTVDSLVLTQSKGEYGLELFNNNANINSFAKSKFESEKRIIKFEYNKISDTELELIGDKSKYQLNREVVIYDTSVSFKSIFRGMIGLIVVIFIAWLFSSNRRVVNWKVVGAGLSAQLLFAIGILKVPFIASIFEGISRFFVLILDFTSAGSEFLLGGLLDVNTYGYIFLFQVLPTIIFFSALTSVLFYLGIIQKIVYGLAWIMTKLMKLSGAESLSVAGNIFLGQTESPLMIKAYLPKMNNSEILLVMIGGMATIAGGVLAAYVSFLGGDDPVQRLLFAKHLLSASIMAAPGAVVISKILVPPTEKVDNSVNITQDKIGSNVLDAIANGTTEGLKLAANVGAMLLVFVAFIAMINYIFNDWLGDITGLNPLIADLTNGQYDGLSLQFILGYIFSPLMWAIGVPAQDMALAGQLLGEKIIMSEFIAYISLGNFKEASMFFSDKTLIMSTYMLCGFANFASIGIQIGGIGTLAPTKRKLLSKYGIKALIGGSLASLLSATMVGMIMG